MMNREICHTLQQTSHEQLREEIERHVSQFLAHGGKIDCLEPPVFEARRRVQVASPLVLD